MAGEWATVADSDEGMRCCLALHRAAQSVEAPRMSDTSTSTYSLDHIYIFFPCSGERLLPSASLPPSHEQVAEPHSHHQHQQQTIINSNHQHHFKMSQQPHGPPYTPPLFSPPPGLPPPPILPPLQHPTILTEIEFAVIMYSGANWKVVNMDRNGPQKNIIWRIPGSNNFLARVVCAQAYGELNRAVGPPGGSNIRAFVNNWEDEVTLSAVACCIRVNEDGKVEYVPGGVRPERQEEFVPWLGGTLGFDVVDMSD